MRYDILLSIFCELLRERRLTASYLAQKHDLSPRSIYRYVRRLAEFLPLDITQGRTGGITLADNYRLPVGYLTREEYAATEEALLSTYAQTGEEKFLSAKRKLSAAQKETPPFAPLPMGVLFLPAKGEEDLAEKLRLLQRAIEEKTVVRLLRGGEGRARIVEPYALAFQGGEWFLHAFCQELRDFHLFPMQEVRGLLLTEEYFYPRPSIL